MITLSNNHSFDFCVSSGALGFDGLGWWWEKPLRWVGLIKPDRFTIVAKTITCLPRVGNLSMLYPWTCVRALPGLGATNAVGLTNPGIQEWLSEDLPRAYINDLGHVLAASVKPEDPDEARYIAKLFRGYDFPFIEVNLSCPNVDHVPTDVPLMLGHLRESGHPIILKLSIDQVNEPFIRATELFVDGYHAINTIPWDRIYPDKVSPIQKYPHGLKGGVSGPAIHEHAVKAVAWLKQNTSKPIIGGGGIFSIEDVERFEEAGASAFSIGTCFLHRPWRPNRIVKAYRERYLDR